MKIKKGDTVIIIAGKDRGKKGAVINSFPSEDKVVVEGVNIKKLHRKADRRTKQGAGGQIIEVAAPVHVSNVQIVDPKSGKPTRIRRQLDEKSGKRVRIAAGSGVQIS
jgi:large subunit ribosomal protein L24